MSLPKAIVDALAGKIAQKIVPGLQSALARSAPPADDGQGAGTRSGMASSSSRGNTDAGDGILGRISALLGRYESKPGDKPAPKRQSWSSTFQRKPKSWDQMAANASRDQSDKPYRPGWLDRLDAMVHRDEQLQPSDYGGRSTQAQSTGRPGGKPSAGMSRRSAVPRGLSRLQVSMVDAATRQAGKDQASAGQAWWSRGWGNRPGKSGFAPSTKSRAARLTVLAQRRLSAATKAVKASTARRKAGDPTWHAAAHGKLLAAQNAASQKLAQATTLQAKTTLAGSMASGRVAAGLMSLAKGLPAVASKLSIPVAAVATVARLPWQLKQMNDGAIASQRESVRYNGTIAASIAKYDAKTENLKALTARDTAASLDWLVTEQNKLRTSLQPIEALMKRGANNAQAWITQQANTQAEGFGNAVDFLGSVRDKIAELQKQGRVPNLQDIGQIMTGMQQNMLDREMQKIKDEKVRTDQFQNHLMGWNRTMANKIDARANAKPGRSYKW